MGFRSQQKSMTLDGLERGRKGRLLSVVMTSCCSERATEGYLDIVKMDSSCQ